MSQRSRSQFPPGMEGPWEPMVTGSTLQHDLRTWQAVFYKHGHIRSFHPTRLYKVTSEAPSPRDEVYTPLVVRSTPPPFERGQTSDSSNSRGPGKEASVHFRQGTQPPCYEEARTTPQERPQTGVLATAQLRSSRNQPKDVREDAPVGCPGPPQPSAPHRHHGAEAS